MDQAVVVKHRQTSPGVYDRLRPRQKSVVRFPMVVRKDVGWGMGFLIVLVFGVF